MTMVQGQYGDGGSTRVLVPAVPHRLIRVLRLIFSADGNAQIRLQSDPGQPGAQDLTPRIFVPSNRTLVVTFGAEAGLVTPRGQALGFSASLQIGANYGLVVWYDVIN